MSKVSGFSMTGWLVIIVIIIGLGTGGVWYWQHPGEKAPEYKTTLVTMGDLIQTVTATGQLNPITNVQVGSQVSGIITNLFVDFNSHVTKGQIVAQLDPSTYNAVAAQAKGDLANAKAALELATIQEERAKTLYDSKILAKADYDTAVAALHQAQAQVTIKEASVQQSQVNLGYTTIYAPVDGIVISRNVDVGQTVAASLSAPVLFMIANDLTKMQIDALVSEADIGGIDTNQAVNFRVDAFPSRVFHGEVVQIRNAAQTNQNVITYDTVIRVDNSELKLRPGMTANVSVITAEVNGALRVPNGALRFRPPEALNARSGAGSSPTSNGTSQAAGVTREGGGGGQSRQGGGGTHAGTGSGRPKGEHASTSTLYVLEKGADGKDIAKPVQVHIGINDGIYTQVVDGLKEGDEVIVGQNLAAGATAQAGASNPFSGGGGRRF
ncbi:MAG: Efflux transporter, family, subunit [Pedosphaera sp.]|nr:Efflux transporter, family, subunit [Pedosphaera sp.]